MRHDGRRGWRRSAGLCRVPGAPPRQEGDPMKARLFKLLLFLIVAGGVAVVGYAYFGDLSPDQKEIRQPVQLNVD